MTAENSYLDIMQDYIDINRSVNNYDVFELTKNGRISRKICSIINLLAFLMKMMKIRKKRW